MMRYIAKLGRGYMKDSKNILEINELNSTYDEFYCECHKCLNVAKYRLYILGTPSMYICEECWSNTVNNLSKYKGDD